MGHLVFNVDLIALQSIWGVENDPITGNRASRQSQTGANEEDRSGTGTNKNINFQEIATPTEPSAISTVEFFQNSTTTKLHNAEKTFFL